MRRSAKPKVKPKYKIEQDDAFSMIIITIAVISFIAFFCWMNYSNSLAHDNACKELNYSDYEGYAVGAYFCSDINGNLNTVSMKCSGFFGLNCVAKNIKIQSYNP